jgi:allantoinase
MRFASPQGFNTGDDFYHYIKDAFDVLYEEGDTQPKMLSIGLHCRIIGRPGRLKALARFLEYIATREDVWVCTRQQIAEHWLTHFPPQKR